MPPKALGLGAHAKHLYNPYVYFWRWATWKVFETHPGDRGVVAFVTVAGFLNGPGFAQMRAHLRRWSDEIWVIDCSPEGHQPEVATRIFQGVQQPVCITIAMRDGSTGTDPAPVNYTSVAGRRDAKFAALAALPLSGPMWQRCGDEPRAPFRPAGDAEWSAFPALDHLLAWSGSGTMPGRTWVVAPGAELLQQRWDRLVGASADDQPALLAEHPTDRRVDTVLADNLPGRPVKGSIATDPGPCAEPIRYGWRTLDRGWIIPDKRVINRPNPSLWQVCDAPGQVFLTALSAASPTSGPAVTVTGLVPDLDHHRGSFGGRAFPLWLDAAGTRPNVAPGLLTLLTETMQAPVTGPDVFAYVVGVLAHPAFVAHFREDLITPGLRVPLTADADRFARVAEAGRRVIWLQTYGARCADPERGRPARPPRMAGDARPLVAVGIPGDEASMPEEIAHDGATDTLEVGTGRITSVTAEMWAYEVSGYRVVKRWFDRRKRDPDGRRSSALDDIVATRWPAAWTTELVDLLHVVALLVAHEPQQATLLDEVLAGPQITTADLRAHQVRPARDLERGQRPAAEKPPPPGQLQT